MGKQVICKLSLRPRVDGSPVLIEAGTLFNEDLLDDHTKETFLKDGTLSYVEEAVEEKPKTETAE